jgi:trimeric autotransporter adhesin
VLSSSNLNLFAGFQAGQSISSGRTNAIFGSQAGLSTSTGGSNTFVGFSAGQTNVGGNGNTYLGAGAGCQDPLNCAGTGSHNIYVGADAGVLNDENYTTRIGQAVGGQAQTAAYIGGISGATVSSGLAVYIDASGKLGTAGGASGAVTSFNGRTGAVVPALGDYSFSLLSGTLGSSQLTGTYSNAVALSNGGNSFAGNGSGLTNVPVAPGSPSYVQNGTATQSGASFNVDGSGTVGGTLTGTGAVNTNGTYQIGGTPILQNPGTNNIVVGASAGSPNSTGDSNAFVGVGAGLNNTSGGSEVFLGYEAGILNSTGIGNTFLGQIAGFYTTTGSYNTYVGRNAGCESCNGVGSFNIYLGVNSGALFDESNTLRIGQAGTLGAAYIAGIYGVNAPSGVPVFVNSSGQLGTGGGGGGFVTSFNGRTGAVVPVANDYSFSQLSGALGGSQLNGAYNLNVSFGNTGNSYTGNDLTVGFATVTGRLAAGVVDTTLYNFGGHSILSASSNNTTTVVGVAAGFAVTGQSDTFLGFEAGATTTSGAGNTFLGSAAGYYNLIGNNNTYLGEGTGCQNADCFAAGSNNIYIGANAGTSGADESNTLRIGGSPGVPLGAAYISGIYSATSSSGIEVFINSSGQLGTQTSSLRFKEQVQDMGDSTSKLFQLRPVTFFYKPKYDDGSHMLQYGLIAEEVAKVYPDLVAYDKDGQPYTVKYQLLASMLLNELQKQHAVVAAQQAAINTQLERTNAQQQQMQVQRQEIDGLKLQLQQQHASLQERLRRLESYVATQMKTASDNPPQTTPGANGGSQ